MSPTAVLPRCGATARRLLRSAMGSVRRHATRRRHAARSLTPCPYRPRCLRLAAAALAMAAGDRPLRSRAPAVPRRVATYNIHAGVGQDHILDLDRTATALRDLHADVIGLQEVDMYWGARSDFVDEARAPAGKLRMQVFFAPIHDLENGGPGRETPAVRRRGTESPPGARLGARPRARARRSRGRRPGCARSRLLPAPGPLGRPVGPGGPGVGHARRADREPRILAGDANAEVTVPELAPAAAW